MQSSHRSREGIEHSSAFLLNIPSTSFASTLLVLPSCVLGHVFAAAAAISKVFLGHVRAISSLSRGYSPSATLCRFGDDRAKVGHIKTI